MSSVQRATLAARLARGIDVMGLEVSPGQQEQLLDYLELLCKWNRAYNLSGIRDPEKMVTLHLLDSLSILPHVTTGTWLDVGTGAGLPGIPLAICCPDSHVMLLDSNGKKTRFLIQAVSTLSLKNTEVFTDRIEDFQSPRQIDIVLTRAFASLARTLEWADHLLSPGGCLLAMKGVYPAEELQALPAHYTLAEAHRLILPEEPGERQLVKIIRHQEA